MSSQDLWNTITEAQSRRMKETSLVDTDGKQIQITLNNTGWYEGFY